MIGRDRRSLPERLAARFFAGLDPQYDMAPRNAMRMKPPVFTFGHGCADIFIVFVRCADQQSPTAGKLVAENASFRKTQSQTVILQVAIIEMGYMCLVGC